jgi:TPR repeat protein
LFSFASRRNKQIYRILKPQTKASEPCALLNPDQIAARVRETERTAHSGGSVHQLVNWYMSDFEFFPKSYKKYALQLLLSYPNADKVQWVQHLLGRYYLDGVDSIVDLDQAKQCFERCFLMGGDDEIHRSAQLKIARIEELKGNIEKAIERYYFVLETLSFHHTLYMLHSAPGSGTIGTRELVKAAFRLAALLEKCGRFTEGASVLDWDLLGPAALFNGAQLYERAGNFESAFKLYSRLLSKKDDFLLEDPDGFDFEEVRFKLAGMNETGTGTKQNLIRAIEYYEEVARQSVPRADEARYMLECIYQDKGNLLLKQKMLEKTTEKEVVEAPKK